MGLSQSLTGEAFESFKAKDMKGAMVLIDSAVQTTERFDSQTWQLRGIIYRSIEGYNPLYYREIAIESFVQAKAIDTIGVYQSQIDEYLKNTLVRYYNDAVEYLQEDQNLQKSEDSYLTYKKKYRMLLDPNFDFSQSDISYYNALGAAYLDKVSIVAEDQKSAMRAKSIEKCINVIEIDSLNFQANLNIGLLYYNQGADYITKADPFMTIDDIVINQQKSKESFLNAIPYLKRAEKIKPLDKKLLIALMSCYYGLHKNDLYVKYQTKVDKMNIDALEDKHRKNPKDTEVLRELVRIYSMTLKDDTKRDYYRDLLDKAQR